LFPFIRTFIRSRVSAPVFVAPASVADVAEPRASADIAFPFDILVPVSVFVVGVDSARRPSFFAFPNTGYYASSSSSFEAGGEEFVHISTGVRTTYGLCSILSTRGLYQNKNLELCCNKPNSGYNNVSDTSGLPMDATTSHSRKKCLRRYQEQRTHRKHQVLQSPPEAPQKRRVVAEGIQYLYLPPPLLE
jgi:hypothetical protein